MDEREVSMFGWFKKYECHCPQEPEPVKLEPRVPPSSPALALKRSLLDPETRGEWECTMGTHLGALGGGSSQDYTNASRDIIITRYRGYGTTLFTPFTLSDREERIVLAALERFDTRIREAQEAEALGRLLGAVEAPRPKRGKP